MRDVIIFSGQLCTQELILLPDPEAHMTRPCDYSGCVQAALLSRGSRNYSGTMVDKLNLVHDSGEMTKFMFLWETSPK